MSSSTAYFHVGDPVLPLGMEHVSGTSAHKGIVCVIRPWYRHSGVHT